MEAACHQPPQLSWTHGIPMYLVVRWLTWFAGLPQADCKRTEYGKGLGDGKGLEMGKGFGKEFEGNMGPEVDGHL